MAFYETAVNKNAYKNEQLTISHNSFQRNNSSSNSNVNSEPATVHAVRHGFAADSIRRFAAAGRHSFEPANDHQPKWATVSNRQHKPEHSTGRANHSNCEWNAAYSNSTGKLNLLQLTWPTCWS